MKVGDSPPEFVDTLINDRWMLKLPRHRHERDDWSTWEVERLAAEFDCITEGTPSPVVFCVGAEEGDFPALYSSWGADVVLIEPNPHVWATIRSVWEANQLRAPLHVEVALASDHFSEVIGEDLAMVRWVRAQRAIADDGWPACAHGPVIANHGFVCLYDGKTEAQQITIDDLVEDANIVPDVVTMDVEGGEMDVLHGCWNTLLNHRPIVFVSIHPQFLKEFHDSSEEFVNQFMLDMGYDAFHLATDHEVHMMYTPRD